MTDPTEDIPSGLPTWAKRSDLKSGLLVWVAGTRTSGQWLSLQISSTGPLRVWESGGTGGHRHSIKRPQTLAVTVENIKFLEERTVSFGHAARHPADLHALVKSIGGANATRVGIRCCCTI